VFEIIDLSQEIFTGMPTFPGMPEVRVTVHWSHEELEGVEDADSNVFHKVMPLVEPQKPPLLITLGGSKAFVLALSQSLQHELADKGVRVQAVLPGATATGFWNVAGLPIENLPQEMVMSAEDMVDAALAGLAMGETVTIPALPDIADWNTLETARNALRPGLSRTSPAARYRIARAA